TGQRRQVEIDERTAVRASALIGPPREEVIGRAVTVGWAFRKDRVIARCADGKRGWGRSVFQAFENRLIRSYEAFLSTGEPGSPHRVARIFLVTFLGGVTHQLMQGAAPARKHLGLLVAKIMSRGAISTVCSSCLDLSRVVL